MSTRPVEAYDQSVYINCPFDDEYRPLFEAVTFCIYDCGFQPRAALEIEDSSQVRIEKITSIIKACRYAVHDISRVELHAGTGLPRFNMPLELGLFLGAKCFGPPRQRQKACIILDTDRYRFAKYISDIAGQDIRSHGGEPADAISQVREFLSTHVDRAVVLPGGRAIAARYSAFRAEVPDICRSHHVDPDRISFRDLTVLIAGWLDSNPLT